MSSAYPGHNIVVRALGLLTVLKTFAQHRERRVLLSAAGVAALTLALRHILSARVETGLDAVGRKVHADYDFDEFDVIICGGGTAGCVLAARLSEDPSIRVLLLEAGGSGTALFESRTPSGFSMLYHGPHVYDLRTTAQNHANGQTEFWPRGKMLGGCSSINAQMAQYGAPSDFDEWASIIGDDSWKYDNFKQYIRKFENYKPNPRYPGVKSGDRGSDGPVRIGYNNFMSVTSEKFVQAATRAGIPFSPDFNTEAGTKGVNRVLTYVDEKGRRVSTESAYLTPDVLARPNLKIATHAQVTRVLFEKSADGETRAVGVEFSAAEDAPRYRARAKKEVILAGGAIHSPHMLLLSGVGPAEHLEEHGIPVVHDLPSVGSHLIDHPQVELRFKAFNGSTNFLKPRSLTHAFKMVTAVAQYLTAGTGPLACNIGDAAAFFRTDDPILFPADAFPAPLEDSNSGPDSPDIEIVATPIAAVNHETPILPHLNTFAMHVALLRPTSTGTLKLKSANPWEHPSMDPNYCHTQHDVDALVRGIRAALKISQTAPLADALDAAATHAELDHALHLKSDAELADAVRARVQTIYHPASTCRMAPLAQGGVVDAQLRVYGIPNLRVCDVSVFPELVSGHPTGACIATAEKLSDILKTKLGRA
ncbi:hypothetical protein PLICRDRAFT_57055 [Plicaturopsis crispa FD-325 SS-3]|uniref:Unplaced genomic scaffold PLICRscaffold_15, whole genome shotgun sequence n=1 Tax=Plicaturopsis crispa FD-325 SS-3 TaxID=944288 RepID=A0A0C9TA09_PLICR|nr:hypothetical protein PLICRDRAFT_57055 [Plicaturopsis crispa FD-325 SS-3]